MKCVSHMFTTCHLASLHFGQEYIDLYDQLNVSMSHVAAKIAPQDSIVKCNL